MRRAGRPGRWQSTGIGSHFRQVLTVAGLFFPSLLGGVRQTLGAAGRRLRLTAQPPVDPAQPRKSPFLPNLSLPGLAL